jgi:hypothetical protein
VQAAQPRLADAYGKLPLSFEINRGQTDSQVKFLSRGSGYSLFLTGNEAVLSLRKGSRQSKVESRRSGRPLSVVRRQLERATDLFPALVAPPPGAAPSLADATDNGPRTKDEVLRMKLVGANPQAKVSGLEELPGKSNYFIGNDPKKWRTNVPNYAKVEYVSVYPGVDLVYYGNQGKLEYDFVVQPGADPRQIVLDVGAVLVTVPQAREHPQGAPLRVDGKGDLVVHTNGGEVVFHKPVIYQPTTYNELRTTNGGGRDLVQGQYVLRGHNRIAFQLANYDRSRPVVIDPTLAYSTYLGGSGTDGGSGVAVDASGNAYVTGTTDSVNFPATAGAFQTTYGGGSVNYAGDAFVTKLNATGSALLYSTYLGGSDGDGGSGIAVDSAGNAYVSGSTFSSDFPTTAGAFQTTLNGVIDAFVTKLNATGSALLYSTYLGGSSYDEGHAIAVDTSDSAYVTGLTESPNFPITSGAFQTTFLGGYSDAFVSKLNSAGSALLYSTYLAGSDIEIGYGIALDASGNAYVTGQTYSTNFPTTAGAFQTTLNGVIDAFVTKLNAAGSSLIYSTYLGGSGLETGYGVAVDSSGNAYVAGDTSSSNFPTTLGAFQTTFGGGSDDAFLTKLNVAGSDLVYSTYLGGSGEDFANDMAIDPAGNSYATGFTYSSDLPTTPDAFQTTYGGGGDAFVSKLSAAGSALLYSTYTGGSDYDEAWGIAVDASGNAYVTGDASSTNFPATSGAFQTTYGGGSDAFVAKVSPVNAPALALTPSSLSFAPQAVGTTSLVQKVTLKNAGGAALHVTSIMASRDFAQTNDCPGSVPPAGSCTLSVTFTPTATGIRTGAVTIADNAPGNPHKLPLAGTGGIPAVSLTPGSLTFTSQVVGTTSPPQPATLKNTGNGPLSITSIALSGDFAQTNSCGSTVNAGASCTFNVTFTPTAAGTHTGAITITDDAAGSPHAVSLTGTGVTGTGPAVTLRPASLNFVAQAVGTFSPAHLATLKNTGGGTLKITSIGRSGDFYEGNKCPSTLLPGASCTLSVKFTPTSGGTRLGAVTIADNAPGSPHQLPLSGTGSGTGSIILQLSPSRLSFGSVAVGSVSSPQTVTVTNIGSAPASFLDPFGFATTGTNGRDFHKNPYLCGTSLGHKASCKVSVFFKPLATGPRTGFFLVRQGAASVQIPLSGTGTP